MSDKPKNLRALIDREGETYNGITPSELEYILDVNKKAIEINIEVERQNEEIIKALESLVLKQDTILTSQTEQKGVITSISQIITDDMKDRIEEIEKGIFRLTIILSSFGLGALLTIIQTLMGGGHH